MPSEQLLGGLAASSAAFIVAQAAPDSDASAFLEKGALGMMAVIITALLYQMRTDRKECHDTHKEISKCVGEASDKTCHAIESLQTTMERGQSEQVAFLRQVVIEGRKT
jgi:hypothetical protein